MNPNKYLVTQYFWVNWNNLEGAKPNETKVGNLLHV
jgi:hypothetical protein